MKNIKSMLTNLHYIILTYQPDINLLKKNLKFLNDENVTVIDNSSDEFIRKELEDCMGENHQLVFNKKNIGYTGGMNVGLNKAFRDGAKWSVLLNDDVELSKEGIDKLKGVLTNQQPGILGPFVGYLEKKRWTTNIESQKTKKQFLNQLSKEKTSNIDYVSGSFMIIHKEVYDIFQGFYPDYFMYYEDVDLCLQAKRAGFPITQIELLGIHHQEGKSIEQGSFLHEYYLARNHLLFVERQAPLFIKLRELIRLPKTLWEHKIFFNKGGMKGVLDFLFLRYGKAPRI